MTTCVFNWPVDDLVIRVTVIRHITASTCPDCPLIPDAIIFICDFCMCMCVVSALLMVIYCSCNQILPLHLPDGTFSVNEAAWKQCG